MDKKRLSFAAWVIAAGILYYLEIKTIGLVIPCFFYQVTGWKCPGCGITRMILHCLQGDFGQAISYNIGLLIAAPVLMPFLLFCLYRWLKGRPLMGKWITVAGIFFVIYFLCWGIIRNYLRI